jgi:hypothetical protein
MTQGPHRLTAITSDEISLAQKRPKSSSEMRLPNAVKARVKHKKNVRDDFDPMTVACSLRSNAERLQESKPTARVF